MKLGSKPDSFQVDDNNARLDLFFTMFEGFPFVFAISFGMNLLICEVNTI